MIKFIVVNNAMNQLRNNLKMNLSNKDHKYKLIMNL